ncbi:carbohydrate ABC transporter permease [Nocardia harenae]|uniref:carbohydrate ABC transporter permease n=1 Tax=Nocardia harenae TaxID=358707 RepID=UPI000835E7C1|nr:carbohydrate ABC transporter permease [Nocardia harenae]
MSNSFIDAHGVRLVLTTRPLRGAPVPGVPRLRRLTLLWAAPAAVLVTAGLIVPALVTVGFAVATTPAVPLWCAVAVAAVTGAAVSARLWRHTHWRLVPAVATPGVVAWACYRVGRELSPAGARAYLFTGCMVLLAAVMVAVALTLAVWLRGRWDMWLPLVAPCAVAALVSGVAFRLIFQRLADAFGLDSQLAVFWWFCLLPPVAFVWTWFGFATALLHDGVRAIDAAPARAAHVDGGMWSVRLPRTLHQLRPVILVLATGIGVAAARMFDAVLIGVPWPLQEWNQGATVFWWRLASDPDSGVGPESVYAVPLAALVGVAAWLVQNETRGRTAAAAPQIQRIRARPSLRRSLLATAVFLVCSFPISVLVAATFWGPYGFQLDAVTGLLRDRVLLGSLGSTGWVALASTALVVTAAVPAALRLAAADPDRAPTTITVSGLVVLAVLPVQTYLGPIAWVVEHGGLAGTRTPLILVHAAAGVPIAVLVLRAALLAAPEGAAALHGLATQATAVRRVLRTAWPALGAVAVLQSVQVWNDFTIGFLLGGAGGSPWSLLLWGEARQFEENSARLAAGSLLSAAVPVLVLVLTWRRWLVPGLTGGAVR